MATVCVPCHDKGKLDVPAMRFVPLKKHGNVPMCEPCWGGGMGPGMSWEPKAKPVQQDVYSKKPSPDIQSLLTQHKEKPTGKLGQLADEGEEISPRNPTPVSPGRTPGRPSGGTSRRDAMQKDRDAGMSPKQISEKYKISVASVYTCTRAPRKQESLTTTPTPPKKSTAQSGVAIATKRNLSLDAGETLRQKLAELQVEKEHIDEKIAAIERVIELLNE